MDGAEQLNTGIQVFYSVIITAKDITGKIQNHYATEHQILATRENIDTVRHDIRSSLMGCMDVVEQIED